MKDYLTYNTNSDVAVVGFAISHCGSYLAFNSNTHELRIVNLGDLKRNSGPNALMRTLYEVQMISAIRCLDFGKGQISRSRLPHRTCKMRTHYGFVDNVCLLAVGLQSGQIKIYSLIPNEVWERDQCRSVVEYGAKAILVLKDGVEDVTTVSFSKDESLRLATASVDGTIRLWDMWDDGNMYKMIIINNFKPNSVAWGHKSTHLCIGGSKGKGFIYESEKPCRLFASLPLHHFNDISSCQYSRDESLLITSSYDTSVIAWCSATYRPLLRIWHSSRPPSRIVIGGAHPNYMRKFDLSPDCVNIVTVSDDKFVRLWNLEECKKTVDQLQVSTEAKKLHLTDVHYTPDGSYFVVSTSDGRLLIFKNSTHIDMSLANKCRQIIRSRLTYNVNQEWNMLKELERDKQSFMGCSTAEFQYCATKTVNTKRRASEMYHKDFCHDLYMRDYMNKLPLPSTIKSYLQFGCLGTIIVDNREPKRLLLMPSTLPSIPAVSYLED